MKKVVVIGGGTGNFVVLSGLKNYPVELSAIVSMADDGGSTGILRDELGVLPPGDVRQCLVALSDSSRLMRSLMNYRFENGGLQGHSFGNLFLSALEKVTGSFEKAVEVIPVTTHHVRLKMILKNGKILESEKEIYLSQELDRGYSSIYLEPLPQVNKSAIDEIMNADVVLLGPGGLHTALIPNLLVEGISKALRTTKAKKVFIINLMNRKGQTTTFKSSDYVNEIKRFTGIDVFDHIIVNNKTPPSELLKKYASESDLVHNNLADSRLILADLIQLHNAEYEKSDLLAGHRAFIRHDPDKIAKVIMDIVQKS